MQGPPTEERRNGHRTIDNGTESADHAKEAMEPKGYPTSDRYRAETAHSTETEDPGKPGKPPREN